jgi:hypothetical protein
MIKKKPVKKQAVKKQAVKKQAVKKKAVKKYTRRMSGTHTDNKSHNVKINVLSGLNKDNLEAIKDRTKFDETLYMFLDDLKFQLKNKYLTSQQKNAIKKHIITAKKQQADNRKILNLLKKSI